MYLPLFNIFYYIFSTMTLYILFESAIGYAVFKLKEFDDVNTTEKKVQKQIQNFETFSAIANLYVFLVIS